MVKTQRAVKQPSLGALIAADVFYPEVYVYPPPRMYAPLQATYADTVSIAHEKLFAPELDIYVHIPFCKQICSFCGYLKTANLGENIIDRYVGAIITELELYRDIIGSRNIKTLHFGGGTPSLLSAQQLELIMRAIAEINPSMSLAQEISIEATPESVTAEKFSAYKELGINRVSLGIQTLRDEEIALSRRHNASDISRRAIDLLRSLGIHNVVADLMIGIEGQTAGSFEDSARSLAKIAPETVELYALGVMPKTTLAARKNLMSGKDIYACYDIGREVFLSAGYAQDCHNRYVLPGGSFLQEDHVFQGSSLLGIGAGARTYTTSVHYRNSRDGNTNSMREIIDYIEAMKRTEFAIRSGIELSSDELRRQYAIYNLERLNKAAFHARFGAFQEVFPLLYAELHQEGLVEEDDAVLALNIRGLKYRDLIAHQLYSPAVTVAEAIYRGVS